MASTLFASGVFWIFCLFGPALGEASDFRRAEQNMTNWDEDYPLLPNTTDKDHFRENIIYRLFTAEGDVLRIVDLFDSVIGTFRIGQVKVATAWQAHKDLDTTHFTFLRFNNDTLPGLAGIFPEDMRGTGYFRFLEEWQDNKLFTYTRTAYNPPVCVKSSFHYACPNLRYSHVYPRIIACTDPIEFHLDFENERGEVRRLYVDDDRIARLAPVDSGENFTVFHLQPVIRQALSVLQNLSYLNTPEDIIAEARDVTLGITELVLNHGAATYIHEISHTTKNSNEGTIEIDITIGGGLTISVEVGGGFDMPGVASASVMVSGSVSFDLSRTTTNTSTNGATEALTMTQRITVGPGTRLQCSAFFKVVPYATIEFVAISKIYVFWEVFDKICNKVVPRPAPLGVALAAVARDVKGYDIIGTAGDAVLVKYRGSMTAEHGIATVFSAEPI